MEKKSDKPAPDMATRSFIMSAIVLATLMLAAGLLTRVIPAGGYARLPDGSVVAGSYAVTERPNYPAWRWLTAPVEVFASEDAATAAVIVAFIVIVGGAFAALRSAGVLEGAVSSLSRRFGARRKLFLAVICLFFMLIGSFMGIFEEVVPLVPLAISLSLSFGWDIFTGLGMSVLAVGFGFSAAVANPFSIVNAQRLAGLPLLSGMGFRLVAFALVYVFYISFMLFYVAKLERKKASLGAGRDAGSGLAETAQIDSASDQTARAPARRGVAFFAWGGAVLALVVAALSALGGASDYILPTIALGFLIVGLGSAVVAGYDFRAALGAFGKGAAAVAPAGLLILMALSVKRIIVSGGVMDTILHAAAEALTQTSGYGAAGMMYGLTLGMNFFIGSASAKAFLLMPILAPLADLAGLSRQIAVQAFVFGDGFSNMLYPTNAVLLISLGLAGMPYVAWLKRTWALQVATLVLSAALLFVAVAIGYT